MSRRAVLVTGAAGGIGAAIARRFASDGDAVAVLDRDADRTREIFEELRELGGGVLALPTDVRDAVAVREAAATAAQEFGGLDVVCANAGVFLSPDTPLAEIPEAAIEELIDVNLRGSIHVLQATIPFLHDGGSVIITSSTSGLQAHPGGAVYAATKTGLIGLARSVAVELAGRGIRVNTVCPGAVDTDMMRAAHTPDQIAGFMRNTPLHRIASPGEVADAVHFLASAAARHITGVALRVDGGDCLFGAI